LLPLLLLLLLLSLLHCLCQQDQMSHHQRWLHTRGAAWQS
jgi:hypothetical protein